MKGLTPETRDNDMLAELFDHAQPRPRPPEAVERELRTRLEGEWREIVGQRRRRRTAAFGLAASFLFAGLLVVYQFALRPDSAPGVPIAALERVQGETLLWGDPSSEYLQLLGRDHVFSAGQTIATGSGTRAALAHIDGGSLRLDEETTLVFVESDVFELRRGRIYFDSAVPSDAGKAAFSIRTPFGDVRHDGTQYLVDVSRKALAVSVREGRIRVENSRGTSAVEAGEQLVLRMDGKTNKRPVSSFGELWAWTEAVSPGVDLDQRPINEFLVWVARETGRRIVYEDVATETVARSENFVGRVDLAPLEALSVQLATAHLDYSISGDTIRVSRIAD